MLLVKSNLGLWFTCIDSCFVLMNKIFNTTSVALRACVLIHNCHLKLEGLHAEHFAQKVLSLTLLHPLSSKSRSEQESKTYSPSFVRAVKVELSSSFDFVRLVGAVTSTCAARSYRCLACTRSWTSRPFAVVTQALSAQPSLRRPGFSVLRNANL